MVQAKDLNRRQLMKSAGLLGAGMTLGMGALGTEAAVGPATARGERPHLLFRQATILTLDPNVGTLAEGDVEVRDGRIVAVGQGLNAKGALVVEARGMILMPGLIDAHWHMWNSLVRNYAPTAQRTPYFKAMAALSGKVSAADAYLGVRLSLAEAVQAGITTVNNWAHNLRSPAHADAEWRAMVESGVRGRFWYGYPQDLAADAHMDYPDLERRLARHKAGNGLLDYGLAVRGPERTGPAIWQQEWAFAREHGVPISTHIGVTAEAQKKKALQQLAEKGLLGPKVQLVHGTHLDDDDLATVAQSKATLCLTPITEMRVGYGLAPVMRLHRAHIPISLGIDTLTLSGNANPFMVMQTTLNLATGMSEDQMALAPLDVLHFMTQGAADEMGLGAVTGSITPGKRADLVLIDARRLGLTPLTDPAAAVVQSTSPMDVDTVLADGRVLKRGGLLIGVDTRELAGEAAQRWRTLSG